ncbi:MAG: uracil-DNA glycosylase [Candidatus Marinimicrobia bacterium]|nr:uracil-DNA glycosylase [Candidatus Neomarinimicrobiota bacterium]
MELKEINKAIKICTKCDLYKTRKNAITGEGNTQARLFLIPQAPGEMEDEQNEMFVGPSGKIFRELIQKAGVTWDDFYISNLIKCMLPKCRKPKQTEIETCSQYLDKEIEIVGPDILVTLGYFSTKYVFEKYSVVSDLPKNDFPDYIAELKLVNGRKIFPLAHPATALYQPEFKTSMEKHYNKLGILKKVCQWYPVCPMKYYTEQGKLDKKWTELYCRGDWMSCKRYAMEESGQFHPDNMLPDGSIAKHLKS